MKPAFAFLLVFIALIVLVFVAFPVAGSFFRNLEFPFVGFGRSAAKILKSQDFGKTWHASASGEIKDSVVASEIIDFYFRSSEPNSIYATAFDIGLLKSENNGSTWVSILPNATVYKVLFGRESNQVIYAAVFKDNIGTAVKSADNGKNFEVIYTAPLAEIAVNDIEQDPFDLRLYLATAQGGFLESQNSGQTWRVVRYFPGAITKILVNRQNGSIFVVTKESRIFRSDNKGNSWKELPVVVLNLPGRPRPRSIIKVVFDPVQSNTLYIASEAGLLKSIDSGETWSLIETIVPPESLPVTSVAISPMNSSSIFITAGNNIYDSNDAGRTWNVERLPVKNAVSTMVISQSDPKTMFIGLRK